MIFQFVYKTLSLPSSLSLWLIFLPFSTSGTPSAFGRTCLGTFCSNLQHLLACATVIFSESETFKMCAVLLSVQHML